LVSEGGAISRENSMIHHLPFNYYPILLYPGNLKEVSKDCSFLITGKINNSSFTVATAV